MSDQPDLDKGFVMGLSVAVAILLRKGEDTLANELWRTMGYDFVPQCVDNYDAKVIRKALRQWRVK